MSKIIATSRTHSESGLSIKPLLAWFQSAPASHRVRLIAGRFTNLRRLSSWPLLALCFITPWLSWNDLPLVHLDLVAKQFRFGAVIFWPEDLMILTWMMMAGAFGLFFVAMASGRLWCGFSCPQTIWTFLFIRLEELIEGSRHKRLRMDRTSIAFNKTIFSKASSEKILRKLVKHSAWLILSLITGITFISYFYPLSEMASDFLANDLFVGNLSGSGLFWIIFIAGFTYLNAGFNRLWLINPPLLFNITNSEMTVLIAKSVCKFALQILIFAMAFNLRVLHAEPVLMAVMTLWRKLINPKG